MRKMPDCPECGEDELFIVRNITWHVVRCYECGWHHTFMPPPAETELDAAIADVVREVRARADRASH